MDCLGNLVERDSRLDRSAMELSDNGGGFWHLFSGEAHSFVGKSSQIQVNSNSFPICIVAGAFAGTSI